MKPVAAQDWMEQRLLAPGPKRILAVDGRGAGAAVSAGLLFEVEQRLSKLSGRPDFRLCDYFDLIGGAGEGALVAACLAMGGAAAEVATYFKTFEAEARTTGGRRDPRAVDAFLTRTLGEVEMGGPAVRSGLAILAKNTESGAVWAITNNPRSRYWDGDSGAPANRTMLVRRALQASLGGATPLDEIALPLTPGRPPRRFADATAFGLANPSLHLLLLGTLKGYGLEWLTGPDRILMLSVGAGRWANASASPDKTARTLDAVAEDASQLAITVLQGIGSTARPWRINAELGDMRGATLSPVPGLNFQRMEALLNPDVLEAAGMPTTEQALAALRATPVGDAAVQDALYAMGAAVGALYFTPSADNPKRRWERAMFPRRFDPPHFKGPPPGPPRFKLEALGRAWDEKS
jgi:hypothetical protein